MMLKRINQNCQQARDSWERQAGDAGDVLSERHLGQCGECREYAALRQWSAQVLRAGEVNVAPPLMSAVWASIHRASEQAWDSALRRSFRHLLPYMVAVVALIVLMGGLISPRTTTVQAANTALTVFNSPEMPAVAGVMTTANLPSEDPTVLLSAARH